MMIGNLCPIFSYIRSRIEKREESEKHKSRRKGRNLMVNLGRNQVQILKKDVGAEHCWMVFANTCPPSSSSHAMHSNSPQ